MEGSSFPVQYLVNLEYLDVSSNRFHGKFPVKELMKLKHLKGLDLSDNFFNDTMEGLCGSLIGKSCTRIESSVQVEEEYHGDQTVMDMDSFYWTFAPSYVVVLLALAAVLCINPNWRSGKIGGK
ncbi:uncharacterized protein LOC111274416 isoform X2 [Durio zibethinus]|uniref:Uncharacterized protein LOC111274416 isoform X2 n=1 Tax=Durio zibethinus TaxID=66656 RepID=A0A6P5WH94_DURZI|nr:uncharacterized protein LOC111274416 isoform X2 [Durio zibethinus]